jgi:MFS family permease
MIIPLLPFYAREMGGGALVVSILMGAFTAAQLLSAPVWGRFSDKYGRRPALLVGLTSAGIAYLFFAFANSIWLLLLSRLVQGAGGGTVGVIQAYVADAVRPEDRAKGLGWLSAATNAGVALGPLLGSLTMSGGRSTPGLVAAALCLVNILFAARFLTESRDLADVHARPRKPGRSAEAVLRVVTHAGEPPSRLIWIYAIAIGAFQGTNAILALFLAARFGVTAKTIGFFYMYIGTLSVLTRAVILGRAVDYFGEARLSRIGLVLLATGLATMPFMHLLGRAAGGTAAQTGGLVAAVAPYLPLAFAVTLLPLGTAFTFPCVTALLSRVTPSYERGLYMGVQQTFGGMARVVFPILAGFLFDRVLALPFVVAAALVAGTLFLGVGMEDYTRVKGEAAAANT